MSVIPRDNIPDHKYTVVCEEHWHADYPKVICCGKERPRDLIPTKSPPDRTTLKANPSSRNSQTDESNHFNQLDQISRFDDLTSILVNRERIFINDMHIIVTELHIILQRKKFVDETSVS